MEFLAGSEGVLVSETYVPFGTPSAQMEAILSQKVGTEADVVLSTVVGEDSVALYSAYAKNELMKANTPIASLTTTESELAKIDPKDRAGHISVSPYFGSLETNLNKLFVAAFKDRFGENEIPGVYSEVGYSLIHVFANAVRMCGNTDTDDILTALSGAVFKSPAGDLFIDLETNHFTLRPLVAKSQEDGNFEIVWKGPSVIRPDPYLVAYDRTINSQLAV